MYSAVLSRGLLKSKVSPSVLSVRSSHNTASHFGSLNPHAPNTAGSRREPVYLTAVEKLRVQQLLDARVHLGHQKNKTHYTTAGAIRGFRHNIAVFDLDHTWKTMRTIFYAFSEMAQRRSNFVLLATNPNMPTDKLVEYFQKEYPFRTDRFQSLYMSAYCNERWLNGTFTNWKVISSFVQTVRDESILQPDSIKYAKLRRITQGLERLDPFRSTIPDFMLVIGNDKSAMKEAEDSFVPMFGLVDTDMDARKFLYPVFSNNDSVESIQFFLDLIRRACEEGRKKEQELFALLMIRKLKNSLHPRKGVRIQDIKTETNAAGKN